jgi:hypothetical protein
MRDAGFRIPDFRIEGPGWLLGVGLGFVLRADGGYG